MMTVSDRLVFRFDGDETEIVASKYGECFFLDQGEACISIPLTDVAEFARRITELADGAHTEPAQADEPDEEGWIEWSGGECPVAPDTLVDVKVDDGRVFSLYAYGTLPGWWRHTGRPGSYIIAYRLSEKKGGDE